MKQKLIDLDYLHHGYYVKNKSQQQLADELGVSQWVISQRMKKAKWIAKDKTRKIVGCRKYTLNEGALRKITPKVAWVLEWYLADGSIGSNNNAVVLGVNDKDCDILHKMKEFFEYSGPILNKTTKIKNKTHIGKVLQICSKQIRSDFIHYGICPRKTSNEKYLKCINTEKLDRCFIRGIFEGDGTLADYKSGQRIFQIVGTYELLTQIQKRLMRYLGVRKTKFHCQNKDANHYMMRYSGKYQVLKIAKWIYQDSQFNLNRKYNVYKEMEK